MQALWHKESMPNHLFETKYNFKKNSNSTRFSKFKTTLNHYPHNFRLNPTNQDGILLKQLPPEGSIDTCSMNASAYKAVALKEEIKMLTPAGF